MQQIGSDVAFAFGINAPIDILAFLAAERTPDCDFSSEFERTSTWGKASAKRKGKVYSKEKQKINK